MEFKIWTCSWWHNRKFGRRVVHFGWTKVQNETKGPSLRLGLTKCTISLTLQGYKKASLSSIITSLNFPNNIPFCLCFSLQTLTLSLHRPFPSLLGFFFLSPPRSSLQLSFIYTLFLHANHGFVLRVFGSVHWFCMQDFLSLQCTLLFLVKRKGELDPWKDVFEGGAVVGAAGTAAEADHADANGREPWRGNIWQWGRSVVSCRDCTYSSSC